MTHVRDDPDRIPLPRALIEVLAGAGLVLLGLFGGLFALVLVAQAACPCPDHDPQAWQPATLRGRAAIQER